MFNTCTMFIFQNTVWKTSSQKSTSTEKNGRHVNWNLNWSTSLLTGWKTKRWGKVSTACKNTKFIFHTITCKLQGLYNLVFLKKGNTRNDLNDQEKLMWQGFGYCSSCTRYARRKWNLGWIPHHQTCYESGSCQHIWR